MVNTHRTHNNVYTGEINCKNINIRDGQTSSLPHVYEAYTAATVAEVYAAAITQSALNATKADGAGTDYDVVVYDSTGGTVNGSIVKNTAYQYDGAKWAELEHKINIIDSGNKVYSFDPSADTKLSDITDEIKTARTAGILVVTPTLHLKVVNPTFSVTTN